MLSRFFIDRPIFATVLSVVISLAGLAAIFTLPVAQYPNLTPPTVVVSANYPGASAETVASAIAGPIEQQVNGVDGMLYMSSNSSSSGSMALVATFAVGTDIDKAASEVQNRVNLALPRLPEIVRQGGVMVSRQNSNLLMIVALQGSDDRYPPLYISNYASLNIVDELKRIPGVGKVELSGAGDYAVRIWLRPDRMAQLRITANDIALAIREQNLQVAVGRIGAPPNDGPVELTLPVAARGRLAEPSDLGRILLRSSPDGGEVRLKDVARIELGAQNYDFKGTLNGAPAALITINQAPGANAVTLAADVRARMAELAPGFPAGIGYSVPLDSTDFVRVSIKEVIQTLAEALLLVFVVVYLFLQSWRATLIPLLAVPVSLLGALAGMYLLGYSINTVTLFGMVLAIGIVVDDAIVVVENVERIMQESGVTAREAARLAMDEVTGPVIAIVLVLCSVFIPVAFLGGVTGELYRQFAVTIAISVVVSGIVALTLTPAMASVLLRPGGHAPGRFFTAFNRGFGRLTGGYTRTAGALLRRPGLSLVGYVAVVLAVVGLHKVIPTSFVPPEDQGFLFGVAMLPDGASLQRTEAVTRKAEAILRGHPAVQDVIAFTGLSAMEGSLKSSAATYYVILKPWDQRRTPQLHANGVLGSLFASFSSIGEAQVMVFNPPPIPGLGITGGFDFRILNRGTGGLEALEAATLAVAQAAGKRPELYGVSPLVSRASPQLFIEVDRDKARTMNVPLTEIYGTLQTHFGSTYVGDFDRGGRTVAITMQAESAFRAQPQDIARAFVRSGDGRMVSVGSLAQVGHGAGPSIITHYNGFPSASISGMAMPGHSSGQAMVAMEQVARGVLPQGMSFEWGGVSLEERNSGASSAIAFGAGVLMIFLILAAQYERWSLPLVVLLALPFSLLGAFLAVGVSFLTNDIYFQIGLVTLVALTAKNAILIVEFAVLQRAAGRSPADAALEAARLRFRPIVMTSLAFILGVVPLVLSDGAGAASRHSIGTGVLGGMVVGTVLTVLFVPLIYKLLEGWASRRAPAPVTGPAP